MIKRRLRQSSGNVVWISLLFLSAFAGGQSAKQLDGAGGNATTELPAGPAHSLAKGPVQILSDTKGINFGPYLKGVVTTVRKNWYDIIPAEARPPLLKQGRVVVDFSILKNGQVAGISYASQSSDVVLDRAAYGGIAASYPFQPLPIEFSGPYLRLRFTFLYNPTPAQVESVRISEILVPASISLGPADNQEVNTARLQAENLLAQIRSGKSFEELADKNQDVGYFFRGQLTPSLEDIVFAMKVGDVSDVIRTKQGFVILKVTDHKGQKSETQNSGLERRDANAASK